jgi:hypothetical protein
VSPALELIDEGGSLKAEGAARRRVVAHWRSFARTDDLTARGFR